eukprot:1064971-Prymnesium_polylepis.1
MLIKDMPDVFQELAAMQRSIALPPRPYPGEGPRRRSITVAGASGRGVGRRQGGERTVHVGVSAAHQARRNGATG